MSGRATSARSRTLSSTPWRSRRGAVDVDDLPEELRTALPRPRPAGRTRSLAAVERERILAAVEAADRNRTRAAAELGIGLATLKRKLKRYEAGAVSRG